MGEIEKNSGSKRTYPDKLVTYLEQVYSVINIDFEKKHAVWNTSNKSSVVRIISDTFTGLLAPDIDGEESESRDYSEDVTLSEQALNEPLLFIKKICKTSSRLYPTAYSIVEMGGISEEESIRIVDLALTVSRHTREELQSNIDLDKMAKEALKMLKKMTLEDEADTVVAAKDLQMSLSGISLPPNERQN